MAERPCYANLIRASIDRMRESPCFHVKHSGAWREITYAGFNREISRLCAGLVGLGFSKGDNIVVIGENGPEWVAAWHAAVFAGGCAVPIDPNLPAADITEIVRITEPRAVFCSPVFRPLFRELAQSHPSIKAVIRLPSSDSPESPSYDEFGGDRDPADITAPVFTPEDPAVIIFTSGTTGRAKGVVLNQGNLTSAGVHGIPRMKIGPGDRFLSVLPLHHCFGFAATIAVPLIGGLETVFVPVVKGPLIVEALKEKPCSVLAGVPQMLDLFWSSIQNNVRAKGPAVRVIFSGLRCVSRLLGPALGPTFRRKLFGSVHAGFGGRLSLVISGGSSIRSATFHAFRDMGFSIVEGYGLTETFGPISVCPIDDPRIGSVGPVLPGNTMKLGNPAPDGTGEVLFRGDTVFPGYYKNEAETRKVFDSEGFFHTGDLGRITGDGFLYLTGRLKDVIVLESGKNVYPDELEDFYAACPLVEEIGIFGFNDKGRENAVAIVVPSKEIRKRYAAGDAFTLIRKAFHEMERGLPSYKKISEFALSFHPLPRTSTRKIKKPELKTLYPALKGAPAPAPAAASSLTVAEENMMKGPVFRDVVARLRELSPEANRISISPRTVLDLDLSLDSLRKLELLSALEKQFDRAIPDDAAARFETVGDMVLFVQSAGATPLPAPTAPTAADTFALSENRSLLLRLLPGAARGLSRLLWDLKIRNADVVPSDRPLIFCANHSSFLDGAWLLLSLPWAVRRRTFIIGKQELLSNPLLAFIVKRANFIAVEREGDVHSALAAAERVLTQGFNLLIFPEGTRSRTGLMGRFKPGAGMLMKKTGAALLPVRIRGSFTLWPPDKGPRILFARYLGAGIRFGAPLFYEDLRNKDAELPPEAIMDRLRSAIEAL